jgi:transcriptional regulator with XRE-family HTH domain
MGHKRRRQKNLARKLRQIREALDIRQPHMPSHLGLPDLNSGRISEYETGDREPNLFTLLSYAAIAGVHLEDIVNDKIELPDELPGTVHHDL